MGRVWTWSLLVALGASAGCDGTSASPDGMADSSVEGPPTDHSVESQTCPSLDATDESADAASDDVGSIDGAFKCGARGVAIVESPHESFVAHVVFMAESECDSPGYLFQITDGSTPERGVAFRLPVPPANPKALVGTYDVVGLVTFSDGSVGATGTLEITSASDLLRGGLLEGRFSLQGDGCTVASGTFSSPICAFDCIQI
jgi:hypothetical protein